MVTQKKTEAFTIRLDNSSSNELENLATKLHVNKAVAARNYLQLCKYFMTYSTEEIRSNDNTELMVLPKEIFRGLLQPLNEENQLEFGDRLGTILNNNAQYMGGTLENKLELIQGLNWIQFLTVINDETEESETVRYKYWWIPKNFWPVAVIHGLLYRILYNVKYPAEWKVSVLSDWLGSPEKYKEELAKKRVDKITQNIMNRFMTDLGGDPGNFQDSVNIYKFQVLRTEIK